MLLRPGPRFLTPASNSGSRSCSCCQLLAMVVAAWRYVVICQFPRLIIQIINSNSFYYFLSTKNCIFVLCTHCVRSVSHRDSRECPCSRVAGLSDASAMSIRHEQGSSSLAPVGNKTRIYIYIFFRFCNITLFFTFHLVFFPPSPFFPPHSDLQHAKISHHLGDHGNGTAGRRPRP